VHKVGNQIDKLRTKITFSSTKFPKLVPNQGSSWLAAGARARERETPGKAGIVTKPLSNKIKRITMKPHLHLRLSWGFLNN